MKRLQEKVIVVTGSSSGFGRGIAKACAAEGAKLVVSDVHENPNTGGFEEDARLTTVEAIQKAGGQAVYVSCDVTKSDQVANLIAAGVNAFGRIDVNAKGTFFGSQEAIKQFLAQGDGGVIINLVSTAGLQGHPNQSVYNISKGAQANLTRCLAIEYGKDGIRVNGICPTYAKTSLTRELFDDKDFDQIFTDSIPLKRWGEVDDIANLAVFLASDESTYIHGDLIKVDGGETLCRYSV